jgi:hypothetical protein
MECMQRILEDFKIIFGIDNDAFCYYVEMPVDSLESKCEGFWKKLGIRRIRISKNKKTRVKHGVLTARLSNRKIRDKIETATNEVLEHKNTDRELLLGFLRGFFAAEGAIIPGKVRKKVPNSVQFPQKGKRVPTAISRILGEFGVESRVVIKQRKADYYCANITRYDNFERFFALGIADMHPEKKEKLKQGLSSYKNHISRRHSMTLKLLKELQKGPLTRPEIYERMDSYPQKINCMIYSRKSCLIRDRLIEKFEEDKEIVWKLTDGGRRFIKQHS